MSEQLEWALKMHQIENCSCSHGCGCQFGGHPTSENGGCEAILGLQVIEGHYQTLNLTGIKMVFAASWPGAMHDGNGTGVLFIDNQASPEQVTALATIMSGQAGGMPVAAIATLFSAFEGPIMADIDVNEDDYRSSVNIEGVVSAQQTPHLNPVTGEENHVHITFPSGGFMWNDGKIGKTDHMHINRGALNFAFSDTFAANAVVNWPTA
ncbi:DUF1326 domain-containing protein [Thalassotalea agarivorans]|uniref:DUF1326 domain-containing protein n=1 Tax=Thalassotalea agarivorans TaxID=349064 RepID=A0A1I0B554_THASX|nr:DUF1326 domain-containing protein [Thalassotalea agarivorans]SET01126.1 hypothetical protein SAMN05660429_00907 [Thalassotalea agarivorans]